MIVDPELRELAVRVLIALVALTWGVVLWRLHRDPDMPNFTFKNLIATKDGYPDRVAIEELGAFIAMTSVLIVLTLRTQLTEWFCGIYTAIFVLRGAHAAILKANSDPNGKTPPPAPH